MPNAPSTRSLRILVVGAGVGGISIARGLLRDGHDVTVFERRPDVKAGGGAVTIWSNGATVLGQLGVDMDGAGQLLSTLRVTTPTGRPVATVDLTAIVDRLGAPVRMVPRRVPLERLLEGFPTDRIWRNARAVGVVSNGLRLDFEERIAKLQQLLAASTLGARADYSTCIKPAEHAVRGVGLQYVLKRFHSCRLDGLENR